VGHSVVLRKKPAASSPSGHGRQSSVPTGIESLGIWARWLETVYLPRCQTLSLHQTYEAMELEVNLVFYDTTTISFSIDIADEAEEIGSDSAVWSTQGR